MPDIRFLCRWLWFLLILPVVMLYDWITGNATWAPHPRKGNWP